MPEFPPSDPNALSPIQELLIDGFVRAHSVEPPYIAEAAAQASREIGAELGGAYELDMTKPKDYIGVMAGVVVATHRMQRLMAQGHTPEEAARIMRRSIVDLRP